jgi:predicted amidophosphoribosyltransferase
VVGSVVSALADLVLPRTCAGCGTPGAVLCRPCAALLARPRLATPRRFPEGFPPTVAAAGYRGPVRPAVIAFKERGRAELARPLGTALALAVAAVASGVPGAAGPLLRRRGRVQDSAGLSTVARRANLAGSFALDDRVRPGCPGLLILVDDVVTSGATLTEAAAVLARSSSPDGPPVLAAVVAATPRRAPA